MLSNSSEKLNDFLDGLAGKGVSLESAIGGLVFFGSACLLGASYVEFCDEQHYGNTYQAFVGSKDDIERFSEFFLPCVPGIVESYRLRHICNKLNQSPRGIALKICKPETWFKYLGHEHNGLRNGFSPVAKAYWGKSINLYFSDHYVADAFISIFMGLEVEQIPKFFRGFYQSND